jgi:hypothetical protein
MPRQILIRIHPNEPTTPDKFRASLVGLSIKAYDISFSNPRGDLVGEAIYDSDRRKSRIIQHFTTKILPGPPPVEVDDKVFPVATAVVEVTSPPGRPEYLTADLRLIVTRGASETIEESVHYNVTVTPDRPLPIPKAYISLNPEEVGLYLTLPDAGKGRDRSIPEVKVPEDGSPPKFNELLDAVEAVLKKDPGLVNDAQRRQKLASLEFEEARHIAFEIVWNRRSSPLPLPPRSIDELYTPPSGGDAISQSVLSADRKRFEAEVAAYYARINADGERLAKYVYSLSAAYACEDKSKVAGRVGFRFPVDVTDKDGSGRFRWAEVVLTK